jgi:hypothetical protein
MPKARADRVPIVLRQATFGAGERGLQLDDRRWPTGHLECSVTSVVEHEECRLPEAALSLTVPSGRTLDGD